MSNKPESTPEAIDPTQLDFISAGCRAGGCCGIGGVAYTQRTGFGIDPLFMLFAMTLFSQLDNKP